MAITFTVTAIVNISEPWSQLLSAYDL